MQNKCKGNWLNQQIKELYSIVYTFRSFKFHKILSKVTINSLPT